MNSSPALPQRLLILAIVLPIAALIGYLLADPAEIEAFAIVGLVVSVLVLPWVLKWHHPMLVLSWNASIIIMVLPGQPYLWMLLAVISLALTALNRFLDPNFKPILVPSVTWTLVILAIVVLITAQLTGGVGLRSMGGSVIGGKKYYLIWFAILGYFALSVRSLPAAKAGFYAILHFASGVTTAVGTLAYLAGPAAYFLYAIFPTDYAMHLVAMDYSTDYMAANISRFSGFSVAGQALVPFFFIRWGARGLLDWTRPWRMAGLILVVGVSLLGGFRSTLGLFGLLFLVQFWNEGLFRTRLFPALIAASVTGLTVLYLFAGSLPMSIQRSLTPLPLIPVSQIARSDAEGSTKWRQDMWKQLEPEIARHFWLGKGFTASQTTYRLEQEAVRMGLAQDYEMMILAGDYHSGWRSILIPFGIWGLLAFLAFLTAGLRVLWINRHKGEGTLRRVNLFLLTYYIAKGVFFFAIFGAVAAELFVFTGLVGLSVSLNGGAAVAKSLKTATIQRKRAAMERLPQ